MQGVYSSRKIEQLCRNHIQFILIPDGHTPPDHCTIARFRSGEATGKAIENLFRQYVKGLVRKGWISQDALFVDGTKIESKANRYTFVWRKTVERELRKIKEKAREILALGTGYATRGKLRESVRELDKQIAEEGLKAEKGRGHRKPEKIRKRDEQKALLERWESYEKKKAILGEKRSSYSKTDPDATFMHMKDDHQRIGDDVLVTVLMTDDARDGNRVREIEKLVRCFSLPLDSLLVVICWVSSACNKYSTRGVQWQYSTAAISTRQQEG